MFSITGLSIEIEGKEVVKNLTLDFKEGEVHAIMGPNGAGKSSLAEAIMGHPSFKVTGSMKLDGVELAGIPTDERAKKGVFLAFQNPEEIEGVKISNFIRKASATSGSEPKDIDKMVLAHKQMVKNAEKLGMENNFTSRDLNVGFSGGEKKRLEMLQMLSLKPKMIILDEIDSGLDVDGVRLVSKAINSMNDGKRIFIIITHYPRILKYVKPDKVHVLVDGKLAESGTERLAHKIEEDGYAAYGKGKK